jgi:two-component system sensor histidine kinase KdpD
MTDEPLRPDPDALLAAAQAAEARAARGRLKIYFGSSAGVGKTWSMLDAAQRLREQQIDVVVGVVETHGRSETAQQLQGLELLPRRALTVQGRTLEEFDLDGALARRPAVLLVDELAHSNVPGSRHLEALAGHRRTARCRHRRLVDGERAAHRKPERRRQRHHRHPRAARRCPTTCSTADEVVLVDLPTDDLLERLQAKARCICREQRAERAVKPISSARAT